MTHTEARSAVEWARRRIRARRHGTPREMVCTIRCPDGVYRAWGPSGWWTQWDGAEWRQRVAAEIREARAYLARADAQEVRP